MEHSLLGCGVYCIVNDRTKTVYVGETNRSFLIRFIEHLNFDKTWIDEKKINLFLSHDTEFIILKEMIYIESGFPFICVERYYSEMYESLGYTVINNFSKKVPSIRGQRKNTKSKGMNPMNLESYKFCFKVIVRALAEKNNISTKDIFTWCYKDIGKKFNIYIQNRSGEKTIDKIDLKELEYIVLRLFPIYKDYILIKYKLILQAE